jgi:predicted RNase H-like HicB family nuclease
MVDQPDQEPEIEALIHPGDDGKFWAEVVGLSGCYAQGDNYSKILARLRDAHELCSRAPGSSSAPSMTITLKDGASVSELIYALKVTGWSETDDTSEIHVLLQHAASGSKLCVPRDLAEVINSGFRTAITSYLAG